MDKERIEEGFEVFLADGQKAAGTVRQVSVHELVIYFENTGDRRIPFEAVAAVHPDVEKIVLDVHKLDKSTREAIRHLHDVEDPRI